MDRSGGTAGAGAARVLVVIPVAAGGCGGPSDLYVVHATGGPPPVLLARSVDAATLRQPEPTPPPPLPTNLPRSQVA